MANEYAKIQLIRGEYTDPLYGICKIDEPFSSKLDHPALQKQIERLEGIKSLGLIFRFFPAANHTKWEHYLGMYNVAKRLKYGLTSQEQEQLQWLCLIRGFGHLPCTYMTASGVFLAITLSNEFKNSLKALISPAIKLCRACEDEEYCLDEPLIGIFDSLTYSALRGALSAYKLIHLPKEINIGHRDTLVRGCICQSNRLYRICEAISRYDYMQRDLHHTGLARFNINFEEVFKTLTDGIDALEASPSMRLLDELYDYLVDSLYLRPDIACCETLLAKTLATKLCTKEIDFMALIDYDDQSLMAKLQDVLVDSPMAYVRKRPSIFNVRIDLSMNWLDAPNTVGLEMDLLGIKRSEKKKLQTYPDDYGTILSIYHMWEDIGDTSTFRVILNVLKDSTRIYPFVAIVSRLQNKLGNKKSEDGWKLAQEILSYAFGRMKIIYDDSRIRSALLRMIDNVDENEANTIIWALYDVLSQYAAREELPPQARSFWRKLQSISRRKQRSLSKEESQRFWRQMVRCLMTLASNPNVFSKCWKPITEKLWNLMQSSTNDTEEFMEALAFSTEIVSAKKSKRKWVLPSVRLVTREQSLDHSKGDPKNEIDVVSIELLQDHVEIRLTESTKSASATKATEDHSKLEKLKSLLESQRFRDLNVSISVVSSSKVGKDFVSVDQLWSKSRS